MLVTWAESELDQDRRGRVDRIGASEKVLLEQRGGVHGASTLHSSANPEGSEGVWPAVTRSSSAHLAQ